MLENPGPIFNLWQKQINEAQSKMELDQSNFEIRQRNVWLNFLILIATILGLSSVFSNLNLIKNLCYWKITWVIMILTEIYGIIMIIQENEITKEKDLISNLRKADLGQIGVMANNKQITDEERNNFDIAALNSEELNPNFEKLPDEFKKIIREYTPKLPFSKFIKKTRFQNKFFKWSSDKLKNIIYIFYILVVASFVALLFTVLLS